MAYAYDRGSSTGIGRNLVYSSWAKTVEVPAYEKMIMIPTLDEAGRPYGTQNIRYWDTLTATTKASTAGTSTALDITGMTINAGTPTVLTYTTTAVYVAVGINRDLSDAVEVDLDPGARQNVEQCLADGCEAVITALVSNLTAGVGDAATVGSAADVRKLVWQLRIASPAVVVGEREIVACLHPGAGDGLTSANEFMNAEVRGDAENPWVRGIFVKAFGTLFKFTTKMPTANGNGGEGAIYVPETFAVGWNQRPTMLAPQTSGLATFHIGYANLGGRVKWDSRGRFYRTIVSI